MIIDLCSETLIMRGIGRQEVVVMMMIVMTRQEVLIEQRWNYNGS